jgi:hypothetical protein
MMHYRQEQGNQYTHDEDNDEQLYESERCLSPASS